MNPIIYQTDVQVRFSDLDPYGHVAAHNYIAYVIASRWQYAHETLQVSADELIKKGIAFYTTKTTIEYLRPIKGTQKLVVKSHVSESSGGNLIVPFSISGDRAGKETVYSAGHLEVKVIDLTTSKPVDLPTWASGLFFHEGS